MYGELFQSTIKKFFTDEEEKVALPLSGGRDSRHILFALLKSNLKPICVTVKHFPPKPDEDAIIASKLTQFLKIDHDVITQSNKPFDAELRKNMLTNFCTHDHAWILPLRDYLKNNSIDTVYDGIGGDCLSAEILLNDKLLNLFQDGKLRELAEVLLAESYLPKMLHPSFYKRWNRELAINHIIPELQKYKNSPNPVGQFYFWNRARRVNALSLWCILNECSQVFAPYLFKDIYDFLAVLPASYFLDHKFHTDAIDAFYPEYARLPYENKTSPLRRNSRLNIARLCIEVARYYIFSEKSENYVNHLSFLLPRFIKGLINVEYGTSLRWLCLIPIYLKQLAELTANPHEFSLPGSSRRA